MYIVMNNSTSTHQHKLNMHDTITDLVHLNLTLHSRLGQSTVETVQAMCTSDWHHETHIVMLKVMRSECINNTVSYQN